MTRVVLLAVLLATTGPLAWTQARAEETIIVGGTGAARELVRRLGEAFLRRHPGTRLIMMPSTGSSGGIKALKHGALDLAISSRPLKTEEGDLGLVAHEFARTPFVVAAAARRRGTSFGLNEVASIYRGDITTWPDGQRIRLVLRPRSDIDMTLIRSLSPDVSAALAEATARDGMLTASTSRENADQLLHVPGALGFISLTEIITEHRGLAALSLDGIEPTSARGANPAYPLMKRYYAVAPQKPSPAVDRFLSFLRSPAARRVILVSGAVAVFPAERVP
jgi:phosphate transport system substrate-binding protein